MARRLRASRGMVWELLRAEHNWNTSSVRKDSCSPRTMFRQLPRLYLPGPALCQSAFTDRSKDISTSAVRVVRLMANQARCLVLLASAGIVFG